MDMRALVAKNTMRFRRERELTQEQLAERAGLSQQYISNLEKGVCNPTVITLHELGRALGVQPADLITPERIRARRAKA